MRSDVFVHKPDVFVHKPGSLLMERLSTPEHWDMIYAKYERNQLGWYAPRLTTSLAWILEYAPNRSHAIVDIGGGSSTLVDELLALDYERLSVVDLSEKALNDTRDRLGTLAERINLVCADIRSPDLALPKTDLWHDRAAFHFLRSQTEIESYKQLLHNTLHPAGVFALGVFSEKAPERCSGLLVNRRTLPDLESEFSPDFQLIKSQREVHVTPGGVNQEYLYTAWRKRKRK